MKVELHLHTSRHSLCAMDTPHAMLASAVEKGYQAVFLTEHDTVWSARELDELASQFPQLLILPGLEKTIGSQHLLILGSSDPAWLKMTRTKPILEKADRENCLTILAHPFRWDGGDQMLTSAGPLPDAIEQLTGNQQGQAACQARDAAARLSLPVVNASDAHSVDMQGQYWIETDQEFAHPGQLREIVRSGAYRNAQVPSA